MTDKERYNDRRSRHVCVDCNEPSTRFARCKSCRENRMARRKARFDTLPSIKAMDRQTRRVWRAKRIEQEARCTSHGNDLPCNECAEYMRSWRLRRSSTTRRNRCSLCGLDTHIASSRLCPKRYSVSTENYARDQARDFLPPHKSIL